MGTSRPQANTPAQEDVVVPVWQQRAWAVGGRARLLGAACLQSSEQTESLGFVMILQSKSFPDSENVKQDDVKNIRRAESSATCEVCEGAEEMTEPLKQCTAWLRAYFCEPARTASLPMPAFHHPLLQQDSFTSQVLWTLLRDVKFGEAVSYKQLADLAGNGRAARAVGGAMRSNPIPIIIPCHRVIRSSGQSGSYGGGSLMKEWLLSHEKLQKEKLVY
ncbi:PREDICTED: methylated-DNA--protein-cysteine methyltransferase [Buceros rhinoceros silvestris]|uniref:methylated-DNA--protein-cysteine methyltransferase n=1 Tax=Buceros rhinoceros silvestris TaxID=175836 RepID=UPI000528628E|nr:PREDICTED: methylated-DNA--protein-cysteine methyltransferase [Buceros rhinoceros silvestris]